MANQMEVSFGTEGTVNSDSDILAFTRVMAQRQRNNTLAESHLTRRFPAGMLRRIAALPVTTERDGRRETRVEGAEKTDFTDFGFFRHRGNRFLRGRG